MTTTNDFWLLAWALLATGGCIVLAAWLREERRQNRYLAALKARDWPEVERLMEFRDKTAVRSNDYCARFERARDECSAGRSGASPDAEAARAWCLSVPEGVRKDS